MATSGRFGQSQRGLAGITIRFDVKSTGVLLTSIENKFREGTGTFQLALKSANTRIVHEIIKAEVDHLQTKVRSTGRRQRGTQYLEESLLDERNREVFANTFSVNIPTWLDKSPARLYWRRIDQGDAATFNSRIFFSDGPGTPLVLPSPNDRSNTRMPQHRGPLILGIGPFPAYRYFDAGLAALQRADVGTTYRTELSKVGIPMEKVSRK